VNLYRRRLDVDRRSDGCRLHGDLDHRSRRLDEVVHRELRYVHVVLHDGSCHVIRNVDLRRRHLVVNVDRRSLHEVVHDRCGHRDVDFGARNSLWLST
jgi:hypothetical protein